MSARDDCRECLRRHTALRKPGRMVCTCDNVCLKVVGRKPDEHGGTLWPQSPRIDLPRAGATREAMVMLTERWRKLLRCSHAALFEVPSSGIFDRETATEIVATKGFHD